MTYLNLIRRINTMEEFNKHDSDKPLVSLVLPEFTLGMAEVLTQGAKEYGLNNWKLCTDLSRFEDALYRHLLAYLSGEIIDPISGKPHMYHIGCNAMFLSHLRKVDN